MNFSTRQSGLLILSVVALLLLGLPWHMIAFAQDDADDEVDLYERVVAAYTLGKIDAPANTIIPVLLVFLMDEHEDVRFSAAKTIGQFGPEAISAIPALLEAACDEDENVRYAAITALGQIGADESSIPILLKALKDPNWYVRKSAAEAIQNMGVDATPELIQQIRDTKWEISGIVIDLLGAAPDSAKPALNEIVENDQEDIAIRALAHLSLIEMAADGVPVFESALEHPNPMVRGQSAIALGYMGLDALEPLLDALGDPHPVVQNNAFDSMVRIGYDDAVALLVQDLNSNDVDIRQRSIDKLGEMGPAGVPGLVTALQNEEPEVRLLIVDVLEKIGSPAIVGFQAALKDSDSQVREHANIVATEIYTKTRPGSGFAVPEAIPFLRSQLQDGDELARREAAVAFQMIVPPADAAAPVLANALLDEDEIVRCDAALALLLIGENGATATPIIASILQDKDDGTLCNTDDDHLNLLKQHGQAERLSPLIAFLTYHSNQVPLRYLLVHALRDFGPGASDAIPELVEALEEQYLRFIAADALGRFGVSATPALLDVLNGVDTESIPGLTMALHGKDNDLRRSAAYALIEAGVSSQPMIDELTLMLDDESIDIEVRKLIAAALANSGQIVQDFWLAENLQNPLELSCPRGTMFAIEGGEAFNIYSDACEYSPDESAPSITKIFRTLLGKL